MRTSVNAEKNAIIKQNIHLNRNISLYSHNKTAYFWGVQHLRIGSFAIASNSTSLNRSPQAAATEVSLGLARRNAASSVSASCQMLFSA